MKFADTEPETVVPVTADAASGNASAPGSTTDGTIIGWRSNEKKKKSNKKRGDDKYNRNNRIIEDDKNDNA